MDFYDFDQRRLPFIFCSYSTLTVSAHTPFLLSDFLEFLPNLIVLTSNPVKLTGLPIVYNRVAYEKNKVAYLFYRVAYYI